MAVVVYNNLSKAVAHETSFVGPQLERPYFANYPWVTGEREGQGPLGAICDVLETATTEFVVFAPCDAPYFDSASFDQLIGMRSHHDVVVAADDQSPHLRHWLLSCWNVQSTRDHMLGSFASGERAIHRAINGLEVYDQHFVSQVLTNVNTPSDVQ